MIRRGFTLIELLVIVAIIGAMITVGVVSLTAGRGAVRVKGAARDVFAAIRQARSVALVTQQPAIIVYSVEERDGEPVAKIEITSAKLFSEQTDRSKIRTLRGDPLAAEKVDLVKVTETDGDGNVVADADDGKTLVEDVLFAPISEEVVKGMRLKVLTGDECLAQNEVQQHKSQISIFSTADFLIGRYDQLQAKKKTASESSGTIQAGGSRPAATASKTEASVAETQEPVKIVWEANGRVDPHRVYVYADGQRPEDGLLINIDRFGAAKVLSGDGSEEK